jgi:dehydrogenase/reductase SDR family protein 12
MSFFRKVSFYIKGKREFKRSGFLRNSTRFNPSSLNVDINSQSFVVTGANSGLGKWTALELAKRGASVHMVCRNQERGEAALKEIKELSQNENVTLHQLDISNLPEVVEFVKGFRDSGHKVDVLINNAGFLPLERKLTEQGFEQTFATNTLGTYLLTKQFMPLLAQSSCPRVVIVSSGGMLVSKLDTTDLQFEQMNPFDGTMAYSQTKRQQVIMAHQMADKESKGTGIQFYSMHPGAITHVFPNTISIEIKYVYQ